MIANTQKQQLSHHLFAVGYLAQTLLRLVTNNNLDNKQVIPTFNAGCLHDVGKLDPKFQEWASKKKHDEINLDEGQHIDKTKFSFENHPRHNEISLLLFNLLRDSSDKTVNRANLNLIEHVIYWHHAKPIRDKDYKNLNDIYKPLFKNLGEENFLQLLNNCHEMVQSVNQQAFDYTQNATLKLLNFCSSLNDDISLKIPLPAYKDYDENDDVHDYRENARLNANNAIAQAVVITADRLISELSASELEQHITHRSLEKMAESHLNQTDELKNHIQACLTGFEIRYPNSERNLQQSQAAEKLAQVHEIAVLKGAAGCGKTKIALEWALKTMAKKIIWVCPRVQICQGLYNDLTANDYLPHAKIEIHTGEFKTISQNGIETETNENTAFSGDIVLTTIDQITNAILTHSHVTTLIEFMNSHVVFDEYHEYINMEAFNLLFAELLECKKLCASNANTLLVSATPNHFFLEEFLNIHVDDCINVTTFNNSRYQICFNEFDENSTSDANPLYAPQPKNSFVISNTATTAQLSFMQNEMRENALLLHSKFKKADKQNLFKSVMQAFGQKGLKNYDVLRSAPVVQAALNITCDNMVSEITNAENTLQRLGRLDRFGQNETVNFLTIAVPVAFQNTKSSNCAKFLNNLHSFNSTKAWLAFLRQNLSNAPVTLAEIYQIYEKFYRDESSKKAIEQDLLKSLKASVQLINKKVIDPVSVPHKKVAKNSIVKIKKNSLRGDNRFVQMAVCEIEHGEVVKFAEDYAYFEDSIDANESLTLSCQEILGYGDSNKNLLAFMAKKHHQVKLPKLRGYTNLTGRIKEENGYKYKKEPSDINFKENPLYISQNCIRHHLFRDQAFDMHHAGEKDLLKVLASQTGLIRGYVVPSSQCKRTSPLLLEDFVDHLYNGNFEQFGQAGARDSSSFFSKTTFGDTEYLAYGSISIEQLQFISLDKKFDRCAMIIKEGDGEKVAKAIVEYLNALDDTKKPEAIFHANYVRRGTIFEEGENGILLNQDAIQILVDYTLEIMRDLVIRQAKGYMSVDDVLVDFNDSNKMMRIKRRPNEISEVPTESYAIYFEAK